VRRALERLRTHVQLPLRSLTRALASIDEQAARERAELALARTAPGLDAAGYDRGPLVACVVSTLALVFMEYTSERSLARWLYTLDPTLYRPRWAPLLELGLWIGVRLVGFFVLPALAIRALLRGRIVASGLGLGTLRRHWLPYVVLFALVLPCIVLAAQRPEFTSYYPFYKFAGESWLELCVWELLYAAHFVALEFFFRGFWLTACRRSFGSHAVFVALAPYCMIHFTKPLLEVLAAIPAGIVLGVLAMRARSIWGGATLHVAVAWGMDGLALLKSTGFPSRLWP
jgi:membrane protease YdiL (CAAX protease family)